VSFGLRHDFRSLPTSTRRRQQTHPWFFRRASSGGEYDGVRTFTQPAFPLRKLVPATSKPSSRLRHQMRALWESS